MGVVEGGTEPRPAPLSDADPPPALPADAETQPVDCLAGLETPDRGSSIALQGEAGRDQQGQERLPRGFALRSVSAKQKNVIGNSDQRNVGMPLPPLAIEEVVQV